jgi:hypothetical protein
VIDILIYTFSLVHNESDIIESLCRYYTSFCDGMLIFDSNSKDDTKDIILRLKAEGLPVHLTNEWIGAGKPGFDSKDAMARLAIDRFGADLIMPVDADEFLFCAGGGNPRSVLETLDPEVEYHIPWSTFVFTQPPNDNSVFLPSYFTWRRKDEIAQYYKTTTSGELIRRYHCKFKTGNHCLHTRPRVDVKIPSSLAYAHYPLRGVYQAMSKIILGEFLMLTIIGRNPGTGFQYTLGLECIKEHGELTEDDVKRLSAEYSIPPSLLTEPVQLEEYSLDISFAGDKLRLRYTDYAQDRNNFFRIVFPEMVEGMTRQTQKPLTKGKKLEDEFRKFRTRLLSILPKSLKDNIKYYARILGIRI